MPAAGGFVTFENGKPNTVNENVVAANQLHGASKPRMPARGNEFFEWLIVIRRIAIDGVKSITLDADRARRQTVLVDRQAAGIG